MKNDYPWEPNWVKGDELGGGAQGDTFLARRTTDPGDEWKYVLKLLKDPTDRSRRARMHSEAQALLTLKHPGVANLVEGNTDQFGDAENVPLFIITERISGVDLQRRIDQSTLSMPEAIQLTLALLDTLEHCHAKEVVHRDIKPEHVILRNGELADPVLIDFGLAFNAETSSDRITQTGEQVGNKFMRLSEQMAGTNAQRLPVSDITQCVGMFWFAMTGKAPGFLHVQRDRKPHAKIDLSAAISGVQPFHARALRRIFDVGFEYEPGARWQRIVLLQEALQKLLVMTAADAEWNLEQELDLLVESLNTNPESLAQFRLSQLLEKVHDISMPILHKVNEKLKGRLLVGTGRPVDRDGGDFAFQYQLHNILSEGQREHSPLNLTIGIRGFEFRATIKFKGLKIGHLICGILEEDLQSYCQLLCSKE